MSGVGTTAARFLGFVGLATWVVSFALPAMEFGGDSAPGILTVAYAIAALPTLAVLGVLGAIPSGDAVLAVYAAIVLPLLACLNVIVPIAALGPRRLARAMFVYAVLATSVAALPLTRLWSVLGLEEAGGVRLDAGYGVWVAALWAVAMATALELGALRDAEDWRDDAR